MFVQPSSIIFEREAAELLKGVLRDSWISWAGAPEYLITDPAKPNVSDALSTFCESLGIKQLQTATEAHYQLGKVERHGQWFEQILARMKSALRLHKSGSIHARSAKNALLPVAGVSPLYQMVFGRNPKLPADLLQDNPDLNAIGSAGGNPPGTARPGTYQNPAKAAGTRRNPAESGGTWRNLPETWRNLAEPGGTWQNLAEPGGKLTLTLP